MKIISFAWTTDALLAGRKTATCRNYDERYARRFRAGDLVAAYDRSPRYKGTQVAIIRLTHDATIGPWKDILTDPYEQEGFAYYDERIAAGDEKAAASVRRNLHVLVGVTLQAWLEQQPNWGECVIRFELVEVTP
jgi:hypothetical protein